MPNIPQLGQSILSQPIEPTLNDIAGGSQLTIDQFSASTSAPLPPPVPSDGDANNYASAVTALSGDPEKVVQTYTDIYSEMKQNGTSPTADVIMEQVKKDYDDGNFKAVTSIISDPNLPEESKQKVVEHMYDNYGKKVNPMNIVAEKSAAQYEPKDDDQAVHHMEVLDRLSSVLEENAKVSELYNQELMKNPDMFSQGPGYALKTAVKDIAYMFVPYLPGIAQANIKKSINSGDEDGALKYIWSALTPGSTKQENMEYVRSLPPDKLVETYKKAFEALRGSGLDIVTDNNSFATMDAMQAIHDGNYTDHEKMVDNFFGALDILGTTVGAVTLPKRVAKGAEMASKTYQSVRSMGLKGFINKNSLGATYEATNPDKAKVAVNAAMDDTSGQTAKALYGSTREEVASYYHLPTIGTGEYIEGLTTVVDPTIDRAAEFWSKGIGSSMARTSYQGASDTEIMSALTNKTKELEEAASGAVVARVNESTFVANADGGFTIHTTYGKRDGGWSNPDEALKEVKTALRHLGLPDEAFTLNARELTYYKSLPKTRKGATQFNKKGVVDESKGPGGKATTYTVSVSNDYLFSQADVTDWGKFDIKHNFSGGFWSEQGSLSRLLFSPQTQFTQDVAGGASNAVNMAAQINRDLLKAFKPAADKIDALPKAHGAQVLEEINNARLAKKRPSISDMKARGLTDDQIEAVNQYGKYQDLAWQVSNRNEINLAKSKGHVVLTNEDGSTFITGKPVHEKNPVTSQEPKVFDPNTGEIRRVKKEELDRVYASGGTLIESEHGIVKGNKTADYVLADGTNHYTRQVRYDDKLLNYVEGYSPTSYKDPIFIVKRYIDPETDHHIPRYDRTIATVGDSDAAFKALKKLKQDNPEEAHLFEHRYGRDLKESEVARLNDSGIMGRHSSQRHRGNNLTTVNDKYDLTTKPASVLNPVDATLQNIRALSRRIGTQPMLETLKRKAIENYPEFFPKDRFGRTSFPGSITQIADRGERTPNQKKLADAKLTYQYIRTMEKGITNLIDERLAGWLMSMGKWFGGKAFAAAERESSMASKWGWLENRFIAASRHANILETNRALAFHSYLSMNPLRQFVIQSHQAMQVLLVTHPKVWNKIAPGATFLSLRHTGAIKKESDFMYKAFMDSYKMTYEEAERFYGEFVKSGLVASIDNHNMEAASIRQLTEASMSEGIVAKTIMAPIRAGAKYGKKAGFDAGEFVAKASAYSAEYASRSYKKGWKHNFSIKEFDSIANFTDTMTLNMNQAGEMLYNKNSLSLLMQFQQAPHKTLLMMMNRQLTPQQKAGLAVGNLMLYGVPSTFVYSWLRDNDFPTTAEFTKGAEDLIFNGLLAGGAELVDYMSDNPHFSDKSYNPGIDFQGTFVPYQSSIINMWGEILTSGLLAFEKSPSMSLWMGSNPRIGNMIQDVLLFTGIFDDPLSQVVDGSVLKRDIADLTSGTSNAFKAWFMMNAGYKTDSQGRVLLKDANMTQAFFQMFGMSTHAEKDIYNSKSMFMSDYKGYKDDIATIVKNMYKKMNRSDISRDEAKMTLTALAVMREYCKNESVCNQEFNQQMRSNMTPDYVATALRLSNIVPVSRISGAMEAQVANGSELDKARVANAIQTIKNAQQNPLIKDEGLPHAVQPDR